jgi:hypothetical protein
VTRQPSLPRLAPFTEDQWGLVTRSQAAGAGLAPATIARLIKRGELERVVHGVYHLRGAPITDHVDLRATWLQLAPGIPAWKRTSDDGVVSHRSAAVLYGLGHLPADVHEFTLPTRRQSRRPDVRIHIRPLAEGEWIMLSGLPVTRPARIASDLLSDRVDPEAVAHIIVDAIRGVFDYPRTFADVLAPHAFHFGLRRNDGPALFHWLLDLVRDPSTQVWMDEVRSNFDISIDGKQKEQPQVRSHVQEVPK